VKDYYKELEIDRNLTTDEINKKLVELNVIWTKRSNINQEKAMPKLLLIYEAQNIFKTEDSRREYDKNLSEENEKKEEKPYGIPYPKTEINDITEKKYDYNPKTPDNDGDNTSGCFAIIFVCVLGGLGIYLPLRSWIVLGQFTMLETIICNIVLIVIIVYIVYGLFHANNKGDSNK